MIIQIKEQCYEISGEEVERIFEGSKTYIHNIIDSCEDKKCNEKELFLSLISAQAQINTIVSNMIDKTGEEEFSKLIGAKKLYDF